MIARTLARIARRRRARAWHRARLAAVRVRTTHPAHPHHPGAVI